MKYWENSVREILEKERCSEQRTNMHVFMQENRCHKLGALAAKTEDIGIVHDILQDLMQKKKWQILDSLYKCDSPNQSIIQRFLIESYQQYLFQFSIGNIVEVEKQQIEMMLHHILSASEIDFQFRTDFIHFFIHQASISSIIHHASLILDTCAEELTYLNNQLLQKDWTEDMTLEVQESDLNYISCLFRIVDTRCQYPKEQEVTSEDLVKCKQVREHLVRAVEVYIQAVITDFHTKYQQGICSNDFEQMILKPGFPILSILDSLPFSKSQKEDWIYRTNCSMEFQTEMLLACCKHDQEHMKNLELYYVLYQNKFRQSIIENYNFQNIYTKNAEYLKNMRQKIAMGQINKEDIIGAIGSEEDYPVFGLFSLISDLPLDELFAIASNLVLETSEMKQQLLYYLQCIKAGTKQYDENAQKLDVQYVKSKIAYRNMVEE